MVGLTARLRRERTNAAHKVATQTFNTTGTYPTQYGKLHQTISGRGAPGNLTVPGVATGTNPVTGGTYAYTNAVTPGYYAGSNPASGGTYAYTNPPTGGDYAGSNPIVPGNYAGTNPPYGVVAGYNYYTTRVYYNGAYGETHYYNVDNDTTVPYSQTYTDGEGAAGYTVSDAAVGTYPGNPIYGTAPGYDYYNSPTPSYSYYNPTYPGNPVYNPYVPGNAYYNPNIPGNAVYNPVVPGNTNFAPPTPGNPSAPTTVLGVTFPGGLANALAPLVPDTMVKIGYKPGGVTITPPPGGYVVIKEL